MWIDIQPNSNLKDCFYRPVTRVNREMQVSATNARLNLILHYDNLFYIENYMHLYHVLTF